MDAPPENFSANPSDETKVRPLKNGETHLANAIEANMQPPWQAGEVHGDFLIRELLGRGKAGFVYSADDLVARSRCAVKVLCRMSSHDLYRNKLGFRRMSPFRHPCLMRTDRLDNIDGYTVLSMEEITGDTLFTAVRRMAAGDRAEAYKWLANLLHDYAVGLAVMHLGGVVHRDLKPTNLMVRDNGHGVIVDYGLVANCDPETDPYGIRPYIAGTPRYFSPEALWDQSYTPAGDVFSLGLVMLDCLNEISGCDLWLRQSDFENWIRDEDERVISDAVSGLHEEIPPVLRNAVAGMLCADRTERPSSLDLVSITKTDDNPIRLITAQHVFGRENELEQILEWVRDIYRGETGRLHLYGEAGAGKTRVLDEVERQLRQHNWGQVYRVKCRSRENHTLQVMDQIADQIAARYTRGDRDLLRLDAVSHTILIKSFPQLRHVLVADLNDSAEPVDSAPERLDALAAAMRLSRELRKVGPLIIIIDDAQWSDHGSSTVWDELQQDTVGCLGIITSSRQPETNQRQVAQHRIHLGPLPQDAALALLQNAATRWNTNINQPGLQELVDVSRGNAFRLVELAEEFRPGGTLHQVQQCEDASISNLGDVDRLWKVRFERLSERARACLAFIVTADAPVSIQQLEELTGCSEVDASVTELVQQRLINDDATGQECITVVHDKIADGLIENLDEDQVIDAHLRWAELLTKQNRPRDFAARIAGHYYTAGQDGAALPFAITAAETADRAFAKAEAGYWHEKVLKQVAGDARHKHLRDAARCYHEADLPEKASEHYLLLAGETVTPAERIRFLTLAVQLLVRSGQMDRARPLIADLGQQIGVDTRFRMPWLAIGNRNRLFQLADELCQLPDDLDLTDDRDANVADFDDDCSAEQALARCRLHFCTAISRPLTMLDIRCTLQLILDGGEQANRSGSIADRAHYAAMAGVWSAITSGNPAQVLKQRRKTLHRLQQTLVGAAARKAAAEVWAGIALTDALMMRWNMVPRGVDASIRHYVSQSQPLRFEVSHTRWLRLWADWHLGRWDQMRAVAHDMVEDAIRRNDAYQQLVATAGYGGNAMLLSDSVLQLQAIGRQNNQMVTDSGEIELIDFFRWMQNVQLAIYNGDFQSAANKVVSMRHVMKSSLIRRIDLVQVTFDFLAGLVSLHIRQNDLIHTFPALSDATVSLSRAVFARNCIRRLQRHPGNYPKMLGSLLAGIQQRILGNRPAAEEAFGHAARLAEAEDLTPYRLAAQDALRNLSKDSNGTDSLRQLMMDYRIECPEKLERLYTVPPPAGETPGEIQ
ncbi:AAA family ATPase [Roseiconus nitratireducens]|uniref:AAA family ATPase n=1 Tax=Roseiconus nitratireducens TaxID=2605748 RepID=A0A5M6DA95_9BACT|nr:AAA family ATPase [Roseiconus nitratireducens]KAA5544293.1 AAA family ATPase [Roseiconus nitratireducens]